MKLWLDDCRAPPEGWVWARTNEAAKALLRANTVIECSLDFDLGLHDVELPDDPDELMDVLVTARIDGRHEQVGSGLDLVHWMIETNNVPPVVRIHSWNPDGAQAMAARLNYYGYDCLIEPFVPYHERRGT